MDWVFVLVMGCVAAYGLGFHYVVSWTEVWGCATGFHCIPIFSGRTILAFIGDILLS